MDRFLSRYALRQQMATKPNHRDGLISLLVQSQPYPIETGDDKKFLLGFHRPR